MKWWQGLLLVGGGVATGIAAAHATKRRPLGEAKGRSRAPRLIADELDGAEQRAVDAGARGELTYIGAGAEGITFCDEAGRAFKVGRGTRSSLRDEAQWLKMASQIPNIKDHVPRGVRYDAANDVIVRECLVAKDTPRPPKKLWKLYERMVAVMAPYGYGKPEFKEDSFVMTRRGPILVDAGFAIRRGRELVKEALDAANGRVKLDAQSMRDLAWALRMERDSTIPAASANRVLRRLKAIEPSVEVE